MLRFIVALMICCAPTRADNVPQNDHARWVHNWEEIIRRDNTAVSPRAGEWMLGAFVWSATRPSLAFDRDDRIEIQIRLIDLRKGEAPVAEEIPDRAGEAPVVRILDPKDGREMASTRVTGKLVWEGGPSHPTPDFVQPWSAALTTSLAETLAPLPDGEYDIVCDSPATAGRPPLRTAAVRIAVARALLEDARAVDVTPEDAPVRLIRPPADQKSGAAWRLVNQSNRPIFFTAYTNDAGVVDSASHSWVALHGEQAFKAGAWRDLHMKWCGTGAGRVIVAPGAFAEVHLASIPEHRGVYRATISWGYSDKVEADDTMHVAHTEAMQTNGAKPTTQPTQ